MKITLCYKDYECKVSLLAMKQFKQATKKDLWLTLLQAYNAFITTQNQSELDRQAAILGVVDFETGAELFNAVTDKEITTQEIEDAMYHSGWRNHKDTTAQNEPWTLQVVNLAVQYDEIMHDLHEVKKPKPVSEQSENKE